MLTVCFSKRYVCYNSGIESVKFVNISKFHLLKKLSGTAIDRPMLAQDVFYDELGKQLYQL